MSQHFYSTATVTGTPVTVLVGWNQSLGQYHMVVEAQDGEGSDGVLYSTGEDFNATGRDLGYFGGKLALLGVKAPPTLFQEVERDRRLGLTGRKAWHDDLGGYGEW